MRLLLLFPRWAQPRSVRKLPRKGEVPEFHLLNIETQNFYQELSLIKNFDEWNYKLSGRLQRIILLENYKKFFRLGISLVTKKMN